MNYDNSIIKMLIGNSKNNTENIVVNDADLPLEFIDVSLSQLSLKLYNNQNYYSAIMLDIWMERDWTYMLYNTIFPSLLFTFMSYIGLFIDKNGVPGRAYLGSIAIVININAYILPKTTGYTWIGNFLLGCLIFGVLTMIEYCILNYSTCTYNALTAKIEDMITQINNADVEIEDEIKVLNHLRKEYKSKAINFEKEISNIHMNILQQKNAKPPASAPVKPPNEVDKDPQGMCTFLLNTELSLSAQSLIIRKFHLLSFTLVVIVS